MTGIDHLLTIQSVLFRMFLISLSIIYISGCASVRMQKKIDRINKKKEKYLKLIEDNKDKIAQLKKAKEPLIELREIWIKLKKGKTTEQEINDYLKSDSIEQVTDDVPYGHEPEELLSEQDSVQDTTTIKTDGWPLGDHAIVRDSAKTIAPAPKYTLNPDSVFFGFSTGVTMDFIEGLDHASLFLDLNINLGQILHPRVTSEFGVLGGKFSPTELSVRSDTNRIIRTMPITDITSQITSINAVKTFNSKFEKKFTRAFAKINYRLVDKTSFGNSKLYLTGLFNYNRIEFNSSRVDRLTIIDTTHTIVNKVLEDAKFSVSLKDTLNAMVIHDRSSALIGVKFYKESKDFEFFISGLFGYTWVNEIIEPAINNPLIKNINSTDSFSYVFQASILEKRVIGAKIGFELRDRLDNFSETPDYFFFISKQFSMLEFFKLFSPT